MLSVPPHDINYGHLTASKAILQDAGIDVVDFPFMSSFTDGERIVIAPYLNFYMCNGAVIVPVSEADKEMDDDALTLIRHFFPTRQVIGVAMRAALMQGGAIHCLTQQVPTIC